MDQDLILADDLDALNAPDLTDQPTDVQRPDASTAGASPEVAALQAEIARLKAQQSSDAALAEMRAEIDRLKADRREPEAPQSFRMSQAERERFNPQAIERISQDPLGFLEDYEEKVLVPRMMARMQQFANPAIASAADLVTDAFLSKNTKHLPEKMRDEVAREFQGELSDIAGSLLTMPVAQRQAEMKRRLDAATGRVAVKQYETRAAQPRTISQGGGASGPGGSRGTKLQQIAAELGYDEAGAKRYMKASNLTEEVMYETLFGKGA